MPLQTFTPPRPPQIGSSVQRSPRMRLAQFGDGYEQSTPDGLNADRQVWSLVWNALPHAEADLVDAFLEARGGAEAFWWTPNGASAAIKVKCRQWRREEGQIVDRITATFRQDFSLDT